MKRSPVLIASSAVLLAGCAAQPADRAADGAGSAGQTYTVSATVLESPDHGPQLCHTVMTSLPPQCGGPDVVGWDWADVDGEESANGTTWGSYRVVGTWDGERLTLTEAPGEPSEGEGEAPAEQDLSTPCDAPDGGWAIEDPATATGTGRDAAVNYANEQADFGSAWLDKEAELADVLPGVPEQAVLNVSFTGDLQGHEHELRTRYGGPLCVSRAERSQQEVVELQQRVHEALGADALGSSGDVGGRVTVTVPVVDDDVRTRVAEVDPEGLVELHRVAPAGGVSGRTGRGLRPSPRPASAASGRRRRRRPDGARRRPAPGTGRRRPPRRPRCRPPRAAGPGPRGAAPSRRRARRASDRQLRGQAGGAAVGVGRRGARVHGLAPGRPGRRGRARVPARRRRRRRPPRRPAAGRRCAPRRPGPSSRRCAWPRWRAPR